MEKETPKLSFSFSSTASKPSSRSTATKAARAQADDGGVKPQFVTVFDPSAAPGLGDVKPVIPPIPNVDLNPALKRMKNLLPLPTSDDDPSAAAANTAHFVLDTSTGDAPAGHIPYGLTLRSAAAGDADGARSQREENGPGRRRGRAQDDDFMHRRYREDVKDLPEDRGMEEFKDINVEDFGAAVLAGYGWTQGQAVGRNKNLVDTKVFEYKRKGGSEGIGYNPSSGDPKKRRGLWVSEEEKEKEKEKTKEKEKIVRVISGRHMGSKGKVLKRSGSSELFLKLLETGEEVKLRDDMVADLGSTEEEKFLRKLKRSENEGRDQRRDEKRNRHERREEKSESVQESSRSNYRSEENKVRWLTSHIRVRIVSKDFMGGKLYLKKGEVIDVVGPTTCDISLDGSKELVQGVDQDILETALPKRGGSVLVLYGKHKGVFGSLVERNTDKDTGMVRDADSHDLIKVRLDAIAEYLGDPSYLGY
ncbi:protein MOS2 [Musa acuminata AAA Group]|uniref:protein MOS2 n=1 Tax=Musa acuminata AAA Group TaxID=214697 RepID=UPI0031CFEBDA